MCGYVGYTTNKSKYEESVLKRMTDTIAHRGPDDEHYYQDSNVSLGFRRLSILDLSTNGQQPMVSDNGEVVLVFNGEIYNHEPLRNDIKALGFSFHSTSDSEVILHGYEAYGIEIFKKISGMFSITIWDKKRDILYMVRDSFGIKPMYYFHNDDKELVFGSEIKGILEHPTYTKVFNRNALKPFLMTQSPSLEETFFKGIFHLKPGHLLTFNKGFVDVKPFIDLKYCPKPCHEDMTDCVHETLAKSVKDHAVADVKVGAFLSGGVDSSYVTALLKPDKTFSVGFEHPNRIFNETNEAKELSEILEIDHYQKIITADEFFAALSSVQYHMDEPHANLSAVPLYYLAALAREHVTVVLSGEGADELFAGYDWYKKSKYWQTYEHLPLGLRRVIGKVSNKLPKNRISNFLVNASKPVEESFIGQARIFEENELNEVLQASYLSGPSANELVQKTYATVKDEDDLTKMQQVDLHNWLPNDILQKADKMSMAHSLELRVPFLSKSVFNVANQLDEKARIEEGLSKAILRRASKKVLPDDWAYRPKVGFPVPFSDWIRDEKYASFVREKFTLPFVSEFFSQESIIKMLNDHKLGINNNGRKIYTILCFIIWYEKYFVEMTEAH